MFEQKFEIDYQGLKWDYSASLSKMLVYLQEASIRHSEAVGLTMDWFFKEKCGWVICDWDIEVIKPLKWPQGFTVRTYPSLFKGIMAHRGFEVINEYGEIVLKAASKWVYTNREKRRPVKVDIEMQSKYGKLYKLPVSTDFKVSKIEGTPAVQKNITVTRRDTDTNRHVNNISYLEWLTDMLTDEEYNLGPIKKAEISYHHESVAGDNLKISLYKDNSRYYGTVCREETLLTEIYFEM